MTHSCRLSINSITCFVNTINHSTEKTGKKPVYFTNYSTIVLPLYVPHEHILCGTLYSPHVGHFVKVGAANL